MSPDKILVSIISLSGIIFIYWFFLNKKTVETKVEGEVDIKVDGGYTPEVISIPVGVSTKINFTRTDSNDCLSEVNIPDFKIKRGLPLNKKVGVEITPKVRGKFEYSCLMNMYHGKIIVR